MGCKGIVIGDEQMILNSISTAMFQSKNSITMVIIVVAIAIIAYIGSWLYQKIFME